MQYRKNNITTILSITVAELSSLNETLRYSWDVCLNNKFGSRPSCLVVGLYSCIHFIYQWLYSPFLGPGLFLSFVHICTQTVGLLGPGISLSQGYYMHTGQHKQNKHTQTFMPSEGFEPMIPAFQRAKTVHALDRAATVIGRSVF
jgi:hypothetical protein